MTIYDKSIKKKVARKFSSFKNSEQDSLYNA